MSDKTLAIFGASFNPPGLHHTNAAAEIRKLVGGVIVVPCGPRPDKPSTNGIEPVHRAAMSDLAFGNIDGLEIDLFDLEEATFTRTHELHQRYSPRGELWHVVNADMIAGGREGKSTIHLQWQHGPELWRQLSFIVTRQRGETVDPEDLPPKHRVVSVDTQGRSLAIRQRLFAGEPIDDLSPQPVCEYLKRHGLYRDGGRRRSASLTLGRSPRLLIVADERNPTAMELAKPFREFGVSRDPTCVLVIGGDGTMLHAIQDHWRLRVPFFGINAGHLGFLLNDATDVRKSGFPLVEIVSRHMPLLKVQMLTKDGHWHGGLTFNDAWIERSTGQTAWMTVRVDGRERIGKLIGDGLLVSTAAGSTAYARSMGGTPLLIDTPAWMLVGSNILQPINWKSALLSLESQVEVECLNTEKRPMRGFYHGNCIGDVTAMRARVSRIAAVELAFCTSHDITEKIQNLQFMGPD